ncbi:MAG: ATP-binding protein [Coriobacteriales bacterium]|nr:ATP-binding protein [Coriobacteriales bacterium]
MYQEECVVLRVPLKPAYARVVRMAAANVASIAGFSVEDVDDIRMAAEEAFIYASATEINNEIMHTVQLKLTGEGMWFEIDLGMQDAQDAGEDAPWFYSELIMKSMCDECILGTKGQTLRLFKRLEQPHALG